MDRLVRKMQSGLGLLGDESPQAQIFGAPRQENAARGVATFSNRWLWTAEGVATYSGIASSYVTATPSCAATRLALRENTYSIGILEIFAASIEQEEENEPCN